MVKLLGSIGSSGGVNKGHWVLAKHFCVTTAFPDKNGDYTLLDSRNFETEDELREFVAREWKRNPRVGINITEDEKAVRWAMDEGRIVILRPH